MFYGLISAESELTKQKCRERSGNAPTTKKSGSQFQQVNRATRDPSYTTRFSLRTENEQADAGRDG